MGDDGLARACRQDCAFVDDLGEVGAGEPGRRLREQREVDVVGERLPGCMHLEDLLAAAPRREVDRDLATETSGTKERLVEDVEPIGCGDDDDLAGRVEAVQLDEQLVQRLLTLVVCARGSAARAVATERIDLVEEDDRPAFAATGAGEELADPFRADAHVHLHELRAGHREERDAGLAGQGLGDHGLPRARRSVKKHAARKARADACEALGLAQEVDHLAHLFDCLVAAGDVFEPHRARVGSGRARGEAAATRRGAGPSAPSQQENHRDTDDDHDQRRRDEHPVRKRRSRSVDSDGYVMRNEMLLDERVGGQV